MKKKYNINNKKKIFQSCSDKDSGKWIQVIFHDMEKKLFIPGHIHISIKYVSNIKIYYCSSIKFESKVL